MCIFYSLLLSIFFCIFYFKTGWPTKWALMKSMMPTQIKQELICQASLFPSAEKLSNTRGHDSCSGIHPVPRSPCHHSKWLSSPGQKHLPVWRQATHQCSLCGDTVCFGGHESPPTPVICACSGHDCEFGGTAVLRAIAPPQSSVSAYCPLICVRPLLTSRLRKRQAFLRLIARSSEACKGKVTRTVSTLRKCETIITKGSKTRSERLGEM